MRYFRDVATGTVFAFEDNVEALSAEGGGWTFFVDGEALPGPYPVTLVPTDDPTPPVYVPTPSENAATRDALLTAAAVRIAPLQDAVDLKVATPAEMTLLTAWKTYRVELNRTDLTARPVTWPAMPVEASAGI
ncbi:tail fiber assembly protein [Cupriavidus sp.]|uniref:tail fiber assembly protein n=1 Tax=Cupriavidus sp. TaxID=1873897 RepID=UPI0039192675